MDGEIRALGRQVGRSVRLGLEDIASPMAARMLNRQGRRLLVVHADATQFEALKAGHDGFFPKLTARALRAGFQTRLVRAGDRVSEIMRDPALDHIHISFAGAPAYQPDTLHVGRGPISGFWYLDEIGTGAHSSLRFGQFGPERIDRTAAEYFFNGVSSWMLSQNLSPVTQPSRSDHLPEPARITMFCQEIERSPRRTHYLTTEEMIRTVAEHERKRLIYLKPHPLQSKPMRRAIMTVAQDYPNLRVTDASVHDLAAVADIVVTQNSRAGFEALMQKKPVVTCAKSDYWHATLTAKTGSDLREALDFGPAAMADFPFEKYLYWFLHRNLLEEAKPDFADRAWARICDKAFL